MQKVRVDPLLGGDLHIGGAQRVERDGEAALPRIFEPFFTTGRSKGGTGLGMAIVQNIVTTALKGQIELASAPGSGTKVTLRFPRTIAD
jgi:signal transduction histidine kinase